MALGDGIRRNIAQVDPSERAMLKAAILEMHRRFYPGSRGDMPPGGVSWWFKQDEIHQATHVHRGPEFLPWHRELTNRFEELLRQINPQLSLHYWDFADDPTNIPNGNLGGGMNGPLNLFDANFMGSAIANPGDNADPGASGDNVDAGDPWLTAGFYDPHAGEAGHPPFRGAFDGDPDGTNNPNDLPRHMARTKPSGQGAFSSTATENNIVNNNLTYPTFRVALENLHNSAHGYLANVSPHIAFRDPLVYLLHSNVDRIFAKWQTDPAHTDRLSPATVYGTEPGQAPNGDVVIPGGEIQNMNHLVEPWSTGVGQFHAIRPWEPTHENQGFPHDYHHISVVAPPCYDTNLSTFQIDAVQNPLNGATNRYQVIFNDVPEEETTWRAAVIRVYTCPNATFRVKPGTEPSAPFGIAVGQATFAQGAHAHTFQDVKIWFQYTAGALGSAPHSDGPINTTIKCDETGQEFLFEVRANSIHRPTVAVQMSLDQSGSMSDPAGTTGATRLQVLKDASNLFVSLIQKNNGIGIIRFDQDAYPPNDPTYGGLVITRVLGDGFADATRLSASTVIAAHGAHGATSVGDGLEMAQTQLNTLPAGSYDQKAIVLLTDGIENQPKSISEVSIDSKTFAVGLGNEQQVNTTALTAVSGSTGGYLLLSGLLSSSVDDQFRLRKFFLQILAGVNNTSIVKDPTGYVNVGTRIRIPFQLSEADINCRVILLTDFQIVKLSVETPDGSIINEGNAASFGVTFDTTNNIKTSLFNLPVAFQANKFQAGTWYALLEIDEEIYRKIFTRDLEHTHALNQNVLSDLRSKGAKYCLSVHSFSNLRMNAAITQNGFVPGSTLFLRTSLTEYNLPVEKRAEVRAELRYPDNTNAIIPLTETEPGIFQASITTNPEGIYNFRVLADGITYRGVPFTREQLLTAAVFHEIKNPPGQDGGSTGDGGVAGLLEKCCMRMSFFVGIIILLLIIIIFF